MSLLVLTLLEFAGCPAELPRATADRRTEVDGRSAVLLPPGPAAAQADEVLYWNEVTLRAIRRSRNPPPVAARNLAMVHVAVYDAVNTIDRRHTKFLSDESPPPGTSAETAAAVAAHRVLVHLYPEQSLELDDLYRARLQAVTDGVARSNGVRLGQLVAEQILVWRMNDRSDDKAPYHPGSAPGEWRRTPPKYQAALLPHWVRVECLGMRRGDQFRPGPPPELTSTRYADDYREVKELGSVDSRTRTADQTEIARFWSDGEGTVTPPGHWNQIAREVAARHGLTLAENARLFALLNLGLADAAIACWDGKYHYRFWRPIQGIREGDRDGNVLTEPDRNWEPLLPTPPFPSYTSGHSSFSGTAATILATVLGDDRIEFTSVSDGLPGVTRSYRSFSEAAREAGRSRIYGGIHWEFDNTAGLAMGKNIGEFVCNTFMRPVAAVPPGR